MLKLRCVMLVCVLFVEAVNCGYGPPLCTKCNSCYAISSCLINFSIWRITAHVIEEDMTRKVRNTIVALFLLIRNIGDSLICFGEIIWNVGLIKWCRLVDSRLALTAVDLNPIHPLVFIKVCFSKDITKKLLNTP